MLLNATTMHKIIFSTLLSVLLACQPAEEENNESAQKAPSAISNSPTKPDSLNTVAAPVASTPTPVAPNVATPQQPAPIAVAAPKVNPAHGLPGHRCDLQVGAPLPVAGSLATVPTVTAAPAVQAGPVVQTIVPPPPAANTGSPISGSKKVNPAHGQPGHRCDIAVGAPLN